MLYIIYQILLITAWFGGNAGRWQGKTSGGDRATAEADQ